MRLEDEAEKALEQVMRIGRLSISSAFSADHGLRYGDDLRLPGIEEHGSGLGDPYDYDCQPRNSPQEASCWPAE
jgi:hypothetical protein